jgi:hypothetical protein
MSDILEGEYAPVASQQLCRKAPVVIEPSLGLVVIGERVFMYRVHYSY